jgi:membrane protein DedA with SNARE-associated domain
VSDVGGAVDALGLGALVALVFTKSVGAPIPVPTDALMIIVAARVAAGAVVLWQAFAALLVALTLGGSLQFFLARGPGRGLLYRVGPWIGLTATRLDAATARVANAGPAAIALGVLLPGSRAVTVAACGLAGIPLRRFLPGLVLGSTLFLSVHFALGYTGYALLAAGADLVAALGWLPIVGVLLAALAVWLLIRWWQRPDATVHELAADAAGAWQEAACPVCLALGAIGPVFSVTRESADHVAQA